MKLLCLTLAASLHGFVEPQPEQRAADGHEERDGVTIRGRVRRAGLRQPVVAARVLVVSHDPSAPDGIPTQPDWVRRAQTDDDGWFSIDDVPPGPKNVVVLVPGYERSVTILEAGAGSFVTVFLRPSPGGGYRTIVHTGRPTEPFRVSDRKLDPVEIATLPGTQGDPLRALQNLPGVGRAPGGLGVIVLRGASPGDSVVFFGEHPIPRAFHSLGVSSVVPADAIAELEVVSGNPSSRYGNTVGGVTRLVPRAGNRQAVHGYGEVDLAGAGAFVEGPVGDASYIATAQRGWIDAVLQTVEAIDDTSSYLLPRYYDYHGALDVEVGSQAVVSMRLLGAGDRLVSRSIPRFDLQMERRKIFELDTSFHRFDVGFRATAGRTRFLLTPAVRLDLASQEFDDPTPHLGRRGVVPTVRAELIHRVSRRGRVRIGADALVDRFVVRELEPTEADLLNTTWTSYTHASVGAYADAELSVKDWTFWPGVRFSGFTFEREARAAVDPRLSMRWAPGEHWDIRAGVGSYSSGQPISTGQRSNLLNEAAQLLPGRAVFPPALIDAVEQSVRFQPTGLGLGFVQALQSSISVSRRFGDLWWAQVGGFARLREGALFSGALRNNRFGSGLRSNARQRDLGLELWVRRRIGKKLYGWLAYTLMQSHITTVDRPADYDQRHNLVLVTSYELPRNWRIGGRFRLVSGSPYTPVAGTVSADDFYPPFLALAGEANSARFPMFHQLDLRVDKRWIMRRVLVTGYFDVQNVYNRQNVEAWFYDPMFIHKTASLGLPIFPSLGFRIDY